MKKKYQEILEPSFDCNKIRGLLDKQPTWFRINDKYRLNTFKEHPGNNIEEQLNGPVNRDTLKEMLFKEFKNLDIPGVRFADQYANNAVAETLITVLNAPQLQEPQFGDAMEKSWPIIFGMQSFLDDNMWSIADEGGILISAQKGRKFKLGKDGLLVEKNNIAQVVNTMRSYITSAII